MIEILLYKVVTYNLFYIEYFLYKNYIVGVNKFNILIILAIFTNEAFLKSYNNLNLIQAEDNVYFMQFYFNLNTQITC